MGHCTQNGIPKETVLLKPVYLKLFVGTDGQVILHYIPNIIIFDVSRDKKYFLDKSEKLFNAFYKIEGNALRGIRNAYLKSGRKNMGYEGEHHIGYVLTIVGEDLGVLKQKSGAINETIGSSVNTPVMDEVKLLRLIRASICTMSAGRVMSTAERMTSALKAL